MISGASFEMQTRSKRLRSAITAGQIDIYPEYTGNGAFFLTQQVGRHLIEGLKNPTVVQDQRALEVFGIRPMGVGEAIKKAIASTIE